MKEKEISLMIVDDHQLIRDGIVVRLSVIPNIKIIAQADNGRDALDQLKINQPDIILMDIDMPIMDGFETTQKILLLYPYIKILILSSYDEKSIVLKMISLGVSGFILKNVKTEELVKAIKTIFQGQQYFSDNVSLSLIKSSMEELTQKPVIKLTNPLTTRELEVLQLIALGLSNTHISKKLFISDKTVNSHRTNLMKKLKVHNVAELIRVAIQHKLI
ncbi:MAG: response regulator transcription factor [Bacteroidetes bacterium]|nr:response regulator transcription factor [Bacteroidota bacterium]